MVDQNIFDRTHFLLIRAVDFHADQFRREPLIDILLRDEVSLAGAAAEALDVELDVCFAAGSGGCRRRRRC
jgi:hypothetical protein